MMNGPSVAENAGVTCVSSRCTSAPPTTGKQRRASQKRDVRSMTCTRSERRSRAAAASGSGSQRRARRERAQAGPGGRLACSARAMQRRWPGGVGRRVADDDDAPDRRAAAPRSRRGSRRARSRPSSGPSRRLDLRGRVRREEHGVDPGVRGEPREHVAVPGRARDRARRRRQDRLRLRRRAGRQEDRQAAPAPRERQDVQGGLQRRGVAVADERERRRGHVGPGAERADGDRP